MKNLRPLSTFFEYLAIPFLLATVSLAVTGCDSTELDPFENDGRYFSVYGYLSDLETNHAIRVIPVSRRPEQIGTSYDPQAEIDAVVTTTDTLTGVIVHWNHRLTELADGSLGHIFRATFNPTAGHTYRLEVTRSDGTTATAETTVPYYSSTRVEPGVPFVDVDSRVFQDIFLPGVESPWAIEVIYHVAFSTPTRLMYGRVGEAVEGGGWKFRIDFDRDMEQLAVLRSTSVDQLQWAAMGVNVLALDNDWNPPQDVFDPEVLAQPGSLSNIENGYGFFGSIGQLQDDWPNSAQLNSLFGFPK